MWGVEEFQQLLDTKLASNVKLGLDTPHLFSWGGAFNQKSGVDTWHCSINLHKHSWQAKPAATPL